MNEQDIRNLTNTLPVKRKKPFPDVELTQENALKHLASMVYSIQPYDLKHDTIELVDTYLSHTDGYATGTFKRYVDDFTHELNDLYSKVVTKE